MRAEKRLRAPDGGLESLSVKEVSEQDKRFLKKIFSMNHKHYIYPFGDASIKVQRDKDKDSFCYPHRVGYNRAETFDLLSHFRRSGPPTLVPKCEAAQTFSLRLSILPGDFVLS